MLPMHNLYLRPDGRSNNTINTTGTNYVALSDRHFIFQRSRNILPLLSALTKIYPAQELPHQEDCLEKSNQQCFLLSLTAPFSFVFNYQFLNGGDREEWKRIV